MIPEIMEKTEYEVELQDLLEKHNRDFTKPINESIKKIIDAVPEYSAKKVQAMRHSGSISGFHL